MTCSSRTSLMPLYDTQSQCCFFLINVNILYYHYCTCCVFGEIKLLKNLEAAHAINIRPISMKFIKSTLNDPEYANTKNHINPNPKRLSYRFWYWTKTAITFGEECSSGSVNAQPPGSFRLWTFSLNIGLNMLPSDSFMSCSHSLLGYSTGEFQALQLIFLAAYDAVD